MAEKEIGDIRRGDIVEAFGGVAEVQRVEGNSEGGYDVTLKVAEAVDKLAPNVLRFGGPDEREEDKDHPAFAEYELSEEQKVAQAGESDESDEDTVEDDYDA